MAKRKAGYKPKPRSITLRRRARKIRKRSSLVNYRASDFLDKNISVRSILKYSGLVLACAVVLICVFMLGRVSADSVRADSASADTHQLSGETKQVIKSDGTEEQSESSEEETKSLNSSISVANLSEETVEEEDTYVYTSADEDEKEEEETELTALSCSNKVAEFDYNYTKVNIVVSNFQRELKGDNWGSITSLKLTITNGEPCTIINPTKIKIKMNPKGKGSVWWDDDVFLSESFKKMLPGTTVSEIVPVHVSYSDIYSEKDFRLTVFDDYDIPMGTFKKYITLP